MNTQFHLIGIGGAGMSVVAELLAARGLQVSGSDQRQSPAVDRLRKLGITVFLGHAGHQVPPEATVVVSTAVRETNPELAIARQRHQPVLHRSQALALAATGLDFVAIAGAHGKTTTSGMLAAALGAAGVDPSFAVGGTVTGFGTGARLGLGQVFVAEADESDGSFLNYQPRVALVTNVEPDHLDHYGSREAFEQAFVDFAAQILPTGALIVCTDDAGARNLGTQVAGEVRVIGYGRGSAVPGSWAQVTITAEEETAAGARCTVTATGGWTAVADLSLAVTGTHNITNAVGAWAVGVELGVDPQVMAQSLGAFHGTGRRFEFRGEAQGVRVFDDYAHHPTEVAAALQQARLVAGSGRVIVVFQPHLYSRTINFATRFAKALTQADVPIVTDIFAAREDPVAGVDSTVITQEMPTGQYIADRMAAATQAAQVAQAGDVIITMGAGDVTELGGAILAKLGQR